MGTSSSDPVSRGGSEFTAHPSPDPAKVTALPPTHRLSTHLNHTETLSTSLGAHMLHHAGLHASSMEPSWVGPGLTTLLAREFPPHRVPDGPLACCHVTPDAPSHPTPEARGSQLCLGTRGFPWGRLLHTQAPGPRPPSSGFSEVGGRGTCIFSAGGTCCKAVTRRPPKEGVGLFSCYSVLSPLHPNLLNGSHRPPGPGPRGPGDTEAPLKGIERNPGHPCCSLDIVQGSALRPRIPPTRLSCCSQVLVWTPTSPSPSRQLRTPGVKPTRCGQDGEALG